MPQARHKEAFSSSSHLKNRHKHHRCLWRASLLVNMKKRRGKIMIEIKRILQNSKSWLLSTRTIWIQRSHHKMRKPKIRTQPIRTPMRFQHLKITKKSKRIPPISLWNKLNSKMMNNKRMIFKLSNWIKLINLRQLQKLLIMHPSLKMSSKLIPNCLSWNLMRKLSPVMAFCCRNKLRQRARNNSKSSKAKDKVNR